MNEFGEDKFEIVVPSVSILAEPPVAVVDASRRQARARARSAEAYLEYLYTPEGQEIAAKHYYRPREPERRGAEDLAQFPKVELFTIDESSAAGQKAQTTHFADGGVFDQIYQPSK